MQRAAELSAGVIRLASGASAQQRDVPRDLQTRLRQIVRELGGYWQEALVQQDLPHVFVTTSVLTDQHKVVTSGGARIPVVKPDWLLACKRAREMVPMAQYALGAFAGLLVCISGGNARLKGQQAAVIENAGGVRTPELTKAVTHLIINRQAGQREESEKEKHARIWGGIHIVWEDWLEATSRAGAYRNNEADFAVPPVISASVQTTQLQRFAAPHHPAVTSSSAAPGTPPRASDNHPAAMQPVPEADDDDETSFLEGVRYCLVASTAEEESELGHIGRQGGATRYPSLVPQLTHIVAGSDAEASPSIYNQVRDFLAANAAQCSVVKAHWLRECALRRETLPSDARFSLDAADLSMLSRRVQAGRDAGLSNDALAKPATHTQKSSSIAAPQLPAGGRDAFKGYWFTLTAMLGHKPDFQTARSIVLQNGGKLFSANMLSLVADVPAECLFALCPFSLPPHQLDALRKQPQFQIVPEHNRVTIPWLDLSVDHGHVFKITSERAHLLCRPLAHAVPLQHADKIRVTTSKVEPEGKKAMAVLVTELGGEWSNRLTKKNTHLITPSLGGDKYDAAVKWKLVPVTPDWLIDSALAGRMLPAEHFYPPEPQLGDMHPEATQFNADAATQYPTQAKPAHPSSSFAGIAALAKRAPPAGMQQRSALDDIESLVRASQEQEGDQGLRGALPAVRPQASRFAAEQAAPPQPAGNSSLLDVVQDSRPATGDECEGAENSPDLLDQLAAQPSISRTLQASRKADRKGAITLPPHVRHRLHRAVPKDPQADNSGGPASAPAAAECADTKQAGGELAQTLSRIGSLLEKNVPTSIDQDDALLGHSAPAGDGMIKESSDLTDSLPSRPGSATCEDDTGSKPARRRGRNAAGLNEARPQQHAKRLAADVAGAFAATQMDFSQQVGYDHTANTEPPADLSKHRRSSRLGESAPAGAGPLDHRTLKERLAKAAATQRRQSTRFSS